MGRDLPELPWTYPVASAILLLVTVLQPSSLEAKLTRVDHVMIGKINAQFLPTLFFDS
jgi:hypothetical protein